MLSDEGNQAREDASIVRCWAKTRGGSTRKARAVLQALRYHRTVCSRDGGEYGSPRGNRVVRKGRSSSHRVGGNTGTFMQHRHSARVGSLGETESALLRSTHGGAQEQEGAVNGSVLLRTRNAGAMSPYPRRISVPQARIPPGFLQYKSPILHLWHSDGVRPCCQRPNTK